MFLWCSFSKSCYISNIVPRGFHTKKTPYTKISSTGFKESWKRILRRSELELLSKFVGRKCICFFKQCHEFKSYSNEIPFIEWFSKCKSILEKFGLKTKWHKLRKLKRIIPQDYLQKHVLARNLENQDSFFIFQKGISKKIWALLVIDPDAVILANLNIGYSDGRSDATSPNDSME